MASKSSYLLIAEQSVLRKQTVRLAYVKPELRQYLLPLLRVAMEFDTKDALEAYLKAHPAADKSNHTVKEIGEKKPSGDEEKPKDEKTGPSKDVMKRVSEKVTGFLAKVKGISKDMAESIRKAPKQVQAILTDKKTRDEAFASLTKKIKESPKKASKAVWAGVKKEVAEIKHAGHAVAKLFRRPPETWDKKDKKAVYATGVYVASATVAFAGGGPLMAAGAIGRSFSLHVAFKAMHDTADHGFTHAETAHTAHGAYELFEHLMGAAEAVGQHLASNRIAGEEEEDDDGGAEIGDEEAMQQVLVAHLMAAVTKVLEQGLSDEEMEVIAKGGEPDLDSIPEPKVKGDKGGKEAALRAQVIRLAHDQPDLRPKLLPLLLPEVL